MKQGLPLYMESGRILCTTGTSDLDHFSLLPNPRQGIEGTKARKAEAGEREEKTKEEDEGEEIRGRGRARITNQQNSPWVGRRCLPLVDRAR